MSYAARWRKGIVLSIFLHVLLGMTVGYVTVSRSVLPLADEQVIELDIMALSDDIVPEPELASLSIPEPDIVPQEILTPVEQIPISRDDIVDSELVPIQAPLSQVDTPVAPSNSKKGTPPVVLIRADSGSLPEVDEIGRKVIVVLRMRIMENGFPGKIEVAVSSGQKNINDAAVATAQKWRFEPAKDGEGRPVVCSTILSIPFMPR